MLTVPWAPACACALQTGILDGVPEFVDPTYPEKDEKAAAASSATSRSVVGNPAYEQVVPSSAPSGAQSHCTASAARPAAYAAPGRRAQQTLASRGLDA